MISNGDHSGDRSRSPWWSLAAALITLIAFGGWPGYAQSDTRLRLATGPADDTYSIIGQMIRRAIGTSAPQLEIELLPGSGALNNLSLLENGEADMVLAQNDVIEEMSRQYVQSNRVIPWRTVLVLRQEPVQVVASSSIMGDNLGALSARPLALDRSGGASYNTASRILDNLKIEYSAPPMHSASEMAEALRQHQVQAGIFVSNLPAPQVAALLADSSFRLLAFNTDEMRALHDASPYYATATIPEHTYPNQNRPIATISVSTVLMCRSDLSAETIKQFTEAVLQNVNSFAISGHSQPDLSVSDILQLTERAGHLHPGTEQALQEIPLLVRAQGYLHWIQWGLLVTLACLLLGIAHARRPRLFLIRRLAPRLPLRFARLLRSFLFHRLTWRLVRTVSLFTLVWLLGSAAMYRFEQEVNTNFSDLRTSSLSILVYLFSGLEDRAPVTSGGWIGSVVMLISGLLVAAYITGQFASEIMRHTTEVIQMSGNAAKNSMLIIGWNPRAERIVREIFSAFEVNLPEYSVTVLSEERVDTSRFSEFESRGVTFVSGDNFDKKLLERVGAHHARSIIIMANEATEDPDAKSVLTVLALRSLCRETGLDDEHRPRICVEAINHRKMELIRDAGADEIVCHQDFGLGVLAQSSFSAKLTQVYQELLSYSVKSCEIYILGSPQKEVAGDIPLDVWENLFIGKTFEQAAQVFNLHRDPENPPILIGVQRGENVLINPRGQLKLQPGDGLIVISYVRPFLENLHYLIGKQS